jgi:hypothetical protein
MDFTAFNYTGALDPEYHAHLYVERSDDQAVERALGEVGRKCVLVSLIGARQTGKTSLLNRLQAEKNAASSGWTSIMIDLSDLIEAEDDEWYRQLVALCCVQLRQQGVELSDEEFEVACQPTATAPFSARGWGMLLSLACLKLPGTRQLLVLLDEIGSVPRPQWEYFFSTLRALHQAAARSPGGRPECRRLGIVLAGAFVPSHLISNSDKSPFNVSAKVYMSQVSVEHLERFVQIFADQGVVCEAGVLESVYHWSGGLLYHVQRLCVEIAQHDDVTITGELVEECVEAVALDDAYLSHVLRQLGINIVLANHARRVLARPLRSTRNVDATAMLEVAGVIRFDQQTKEWKITNRLCEFALQQYFAVEGAIVYPTDEYTPYEHRLRGLLDLLSQGHPRYEEALLYQHRLIENITKSRFYSDTTDRRAERAEIANYLNELSLATLHKTFAELYQ